MGIIRDNPTKIWITTALSGMMILQQQIIKILKSILRKPSVEP